MRTGKLTLLSKRIPPLRQPMPQCHQRWRGNNIAATYATKTALAGKQDKIADSLTIDGATGSTIINNNTIKVQDDVNTWHSTTITSSSIDFGSGATTISEDFIGTTSLSASKLTMDTESNPSITLYY